MTPLFTAKCINNYDGDIIVGAEYPVYAINFDQAREAFVFLILTKGGFKSIKSSRFTYETKLEKSLK